MTLPRYGRTEQERDINAALEALQPEYRTVTTRASWPLSLRTRIRRPRCVHVAQAYETQAPSTALQVSALPHWLLSNDPREPGIVIYDIDGLTAGTDYTVTLRIEGGAQ